MFGGLYRPKAGKFGAYKTLAGYPREEEAFQILRKVAKVVKHAMKARNWGVRTLAEFYPGDETLMGVNTDRGHKIQLRLRCSSDENSFLPFEDIMDTMCHELAHMNHDHHTSKFNRLWEELNHECEQRDSLDKGVFPGFQTWKHIVSWDWTWTDIISRESQRRDIVSRQRNCWIRDLISSLWPWRDHDIASKDRSIHRILAQFTVWKDFQASAISRRQSTWSTSIWN
ncbi:Fc.00g019530.m01.CDS01 [Cosmosporella sp. VM-42]